MCKYAGSSNQPCQATGNAAYLWDVAGSLPLLLKDGSTAYVYGPGGLPVEQVSSSTTYWFHHDQLGSTRVLTDSTGTAQATYAFDPLGGIASTTGSISNPFRFDGEYLDSESGFYYLRARYYDPSTGQFLTVDPLVSTTRLPYTFVASNPLNHIDPSGECGPFCVVAIFVLVATAIGVGCVALCPGQPTQPAYPKHPLPQPSPSPCTVRIPYSCPSPSPSTTSCPQHETCEAPRPGSCNNQSGCIGPEPSPTPPGAGPNEPNSGYPDPGAEDPTRGEPGEYAHFSDYGSEFACTNTATLAA